MSPWLYRSATGTPPPSGTAFTLGFDLQQNSPDSGGVDAISAANAKGVMATLAAAAPVVMDFSLMSFGMGNPQAIQGGGYTWTSHNKRAAMITAAGGIPTLTLINCPAWMQLGQPGLPTATATATGGTIAAGTWRVRVSTVVAGGAESHASAESANIVTSGSTSKITVTWAAPTTVTPVSYNLYFGLAGAEQLVKTGIATTSTTFTGGIGTTLVGDYAGSGSDVPPDPTHYSDFATLCAAAATHFNGVNNPTLITNYICWNEMKGFFNHITSRWDYELYTTMYNKVWAAVKAVRPDALLGGPYVACASQDTSTGHDAPAGFKITNAAGTSLGTLSPPANNGPCTTAGKWGYIDQRRLDVVAYWLGNCTGLDFICVDGSSAIQNSGPGGQIGNPAVTDGVTNSMKYYDVARWMAAEMTAILPGRGMASVPMWWIESKISAGLNITGIAIGASPTKVTALAHGLTTGDSGIYVSAVAQTVGINGGPYTVTVVDVDNFTIPVTTSGSYTTVLSNGQAYTTGFVTAAPAWTDAQQCATRIATLMLMAAGGITVGMWWEPEAIPKQSDMAIWTSSVIPTPPPAYLTAGGTITLLGTTLLSVLPALATPITLVGGQPTGVVVGTTATKTILVNTNNASATAADSTALAAGQVLVR